MIIFDWNHADVPNEIMGSNPTQGRTPGSDFDLNNIVCASVNTESLYIPISQI